MNAERTQGGLSARTLTIAAAASAAAAFLVPLLWKPGTVVAAAMTPIIVAIVSEALKRPADRVSAVRTRRTTAGFPVAENPFDPLAPTPEEELAALSSRSAPRSTHSRRRLLTPRQWKLGLATGVTAFFVAASVVTASDFLAGDSVTAGGSRTTLFGGSADDSSGGKSESRKARKQAEKEQPAAPQATAAPETTAPAETATPVPTATATTTPTAPKTIAPTPEPTVAP